MLGNGSSPFPTNFMKYLYLILILILAGCSSPSNYDPYSQGRPGVMYHYSGSIKHQCFKCSNKSNLFRLDNKGRVICKKCFQASKKKYLYH